MTNPAEATAPVRLSLLDSLAALGAAVKPVFPFYIARTIRNALNAPDPEQVIAGCESDEHGHMIRTIGDCRYALTVKDTSGTRYRVTVEVLK